MTGRVSYQEPPQPALLFDLDGTLIDSVYQNVIAWRHAARVPGPLASYVAGFRAELVVPGYTPRVAQDSAYVLAHLSRWLESEGIAAAGLTSQQVVRFAGARREGGYRRWVTVRSLRRQLGYRRETGVIPQEEHREIGCPVERALQACRLCLHRERRLAERTARQRADVARRFLRAQVKEGELRLDRLGPAAVIGFIVDESRRYATASMKVTTAAVRSLLRYLFVTGVIDRDLAEAVPSVASWRCSCARVVPARRCHASRPSWSPAAHPAAPASPPAGAHKLRHRAASRVLAQGGSLAGVTQLLRHHGGETAAIYAKADRAALLIVTHNIEEAVILAERIFVLGANPGRIRAEIQCAFPRPRDRHGESFEALVDEIYGFHDRTRRPAAGTRLDGGLPQGGVAHRHPAPVSHRRRHGRLARDCRGARRA
jgi:hypothetical protein